MPNFMTLKIAVIPTKQLISSVSREADRYMPTGHLRNKEGRNLGGIRKWLIIEGGKFWDNINCFLRGGYRVLYVLSQDDLLLSLHLQPHCIRFR